MKYNVKTRFLSLVLCVCMLVPMLTQIIPVYSVGEESSSATNYGAAIGAIAEWDVESTLLASNHYESGDDIHGGVSVSELPEKLTIVNYAFDEVNAQLWYKVDAAPGYTWPEEFANYHWVYDYAVKIVSQNGMTGVFDSEGNAVTEMTMGVYDKPVLTAESSLQGSVKYQWQIEYEDGKWVDIYGQNKADLTVSIGMIATLLVDGSANVRCVSASASKTVISDTISITVDFDDVGGGDEQDPTDPPMSDDYVNITVNGVESNQTTIEYDDYDYNNSPIVNGTQTLSFNTSLTGEYTYSWQARTGGDEDGEWTEIATGETYTISRYNLDKYMKASTDGYVAYVRLVLTQGETVVASEMLIVTINERDPLLYYGTISNSYTTTEGNSVNVSVSGNMDTDATLNLGDATGTTVPNVDPEDIALALDVTITKNGVEWQPAEGEEVYVSIPAYQLGLEDGDYFTVYHIHDGKTELIGPFQVKDGKATFTIDGFSVVVISTNYGAAIGGVAEFAGSSVILDISPVSFDGMTVWVEDANLPAKVVIKNYYFDDYLGKLFYEIDAAPGYTWPAEYVDLHWCYSDALKNIDINGSMGMFDENGNPVSFVELPLSAKPTYTAQSSLTGDVKYQWQICYDVQNYLWMDIDGQTDASITLSYALLASMLDENGMCAVRCMISNAAKTQEGYPLVIAFDDGSSDEPIVDNNANITVNGKECDSANLADKYDKWDDSVGEYVPVEGGSLNLSVNTNLTGDDATYLWQGLSGEEWVTLSTSKDYTLTFSDLVHYQAYSGSTAYIRVVVTQGETVVESEQLVVTIVSADTSANTYLLYVVGDRVVYSTPAMYASASNDIAVVADENTPSTVLVTVQFVMGNNTAPIENGLFTYNVPYNGNVTDTIIIPEVQGYAAYLEDDRNTIYSGTYPLNEFNITESKTITFRFWPAEVDYKVVFMQQNVSDDEYTIVRTDELKGLTGSDPVVANISYDGFVLVWCDTDKIAADGSTTIEVKYDRLYFKMLFDLDGGYGVQPVYARYGTPVTVTNPTKAGYSFMGWNALNGPYNTSDDAETADIANFTDVKIPAEHTNYKAIWKATEAAKVTVIVWGQKADNSDDLMDPDSYAYMSKTEDGTDLTNLHFSAKPGTSVTYDPTTGGYICGYTEEHKHGEGDCSATCGKDEHTHSAVGGACYEQNCGKDEHTHSDSCYACGQSSHAHDQTCYDSDSTKIGAAFGESNPINYIDGTESNGYVGEQITLWQNTGYKYVYYNGTWYRYTGTAEIGTTLTFVCGKTEGNHSHSDACGYNCAGEHTHTDDCYERICGTEEHTHDASCYAGCTKEEHTHGSACSLTIPMESDLWEFDHASTVTVAADGTSTLNVYYRRKKFTLTFNYSYSNGTYGKNESITARWGQNIGKEYTTIATNAGGTFWSETNTPDGRENTYTNYIGIMPKRNITYYNWGESGRTGTMTYYGLNLEGVYEEMFSVPDVGGFNVTVEDRYEFEGFTYDHGTDLGEECGGAKFYYTRNDYNLVFDNYGTTFKNESVLYEAPLSGYDPEEDDEYKVPDSQAPAYYQPGSVTFAGWYAAPQTPGDFNFDNVTPFDFANSKMPASDLKLYAWWKPVEHTVTFYYDYEDLEAGTIYEEDGVEKVLTVPHGSKIQDPYIPPKDPTSNYYSFEGWAYRDANGTEILWDFENSTVTGDVALYGKWKSTTPAEYSIYFVTIKDGVEVKIADPIIGKALGGTNKTFDAKFNEDLYEGYQDRYYPRVMSHAITINIEDPTKNTFTFIYDYVEYTSYTVRYLDKETGKPMSEIDSTYPAQKTVSNNTHAMVTETFVAIPGYLPDAYQKVCKIDPYGTNEIIFYYTKDNENGLWTVHYWLENLDGTYTEAVDMLFTGTAKAGSTVTAPTDTVIKDYYYYAVHPNNVSTGTVSIDKVTHLHMYYNRTVHDYTVQYLEAGTNKVLATEKDVEDLKWGTMITENAIDITNYQVYGLATQSLEISVDETKNEITFYYTEKRVAIKYAVVGPDGTVDLDGDADYGKVTPNTESVKVSTGNATGSTATANGNVYKFFGWYSDAACTNKISNSATYVPTKADGTLWVDGTTYYAKFEYNLTSLTIQKEGWNTADPNQTFIFTIVDNDGLNLTVTVHGNGSTTIDGLTVGKEYTITEKTDWSWRYNCTGWSHDNGVSGSGNIATITLGLDGTITFTNTRSEEKWLDGDSWCDNIFTTAIAQNVNS